MKDIKIKTVCPLGRKCEKIVNGDDEPYIERCEWYIQLQGKHPLTGEDVDEWGCAIPWGVIMMGQVAQTNRGITSAVSNATNVIADFKEHRQALDSGFNNTKVLT